jgi:hypothetical protein
MTIGAMLEWIVNGIRLVKPGIACWSLGDLQKCHDPWVGLPLSSRGLRIACKQRIEPMRSGSHVASGSLGEYSDEFASFKACEHNPADLIVQVYRYLGAHAPIRVAVSLQIPISVSIRHGSFPEHFLLPTHESIEMGKPAAFYDSAHLQASISSYLVWDMSGQTCSRSSGAWGVGKHMSVGKGHLSYEILAALEFFLGFAWEADDQIRGYAQIRDGVARLPYQFGIGIRLYGPSHTT